MCMACVQHFIGRSETQVGYGEVRKSEDLHGDNIGKEYMMDGSREGGREVPMSGHC